MRRSTWLGLVLFGVLLVAAGSYTGYWFIVAGRIADGVVRWAQSERADKLHLSWQKLAVTGFPTSFRVALEAVIVRDDALTPSPMFRIPAVSASARPWDFADWGLAAREGFEADIAGTGERAPARLSVQTADGVVSIEPGGGWRLWLRAQEASLEAARRVRVNSADAWVTAPPRQLDRHAEPQLTLAVNARQVMLPVGVEPLGNTIEEFDFGAKVKGAIPNGRLPEAIAAWRDAGGTIEFDNLRLKWGPVDATASGTIAFDQELQPVVAFLGGIEGYDELLKALVERGQMRASDASLAQIALTLLAKSGPNGRPEIRTAFSIRNGQFFLGPAKLGKAPRLTWE